MKKLLILAGILLLVAVPGLANDKSMLDEGTFVPAELPEGNACLTIDGVLGSGSPSYPGTSGSMTGRLNRNGVASSCAVPKFCDLFVNDPGRDFDSYSIPNNTGGTVCVDVTLNVIDQAGCNLQAISYLNNFDPADICGAGSTYLADAGVSSGIPPNATMFSGDVPDGDNLIVVVHPITPGDGVGCNYEIEIAGATCIGGPPPMSTPIIEVPTVSRGGMVVLFLLFAVGAAWILRRNAAA